MLEYNCGILFGKKRIPILTLMKNPVCEPSADAIFSTLRIVAGLAPLTAGHVQKRVHAKRAGVCRCKQNSDTALLSITSPDALMLILMS